MTHSRIGSVKPSAVATICPVKDAMTIDSVPFGAVPMPLI